MPINKLNITFTPAQELAIKNALIAIDTNFPFAQNLTDGEKKENPTIDNERLPFVKRTIEVHAANNPILVSGFAGSLADAQNDWTVYNQLEGYIQPLQMLLNKMLETQMVAGAELYAFMRELYASAQRADENMVPGAKAVVTDISPLFESLGTKPLPPNP